MSYESATSQLDAAQAALSAGDPDRLDAAIDGLTDAYDQVKMAERARVARLQAARTEADLSPADQQAITTYERSFMASYFGRGGFIGAAELYLLDPAEADAADLAAQAATLVDREQQLEEVTSDASSVLETATVPARLGVLSFSPADQAPRLGSSTTVELVVENVGDEPAADIAVTVEADHLDDARTATLGSAAAGTRDDVSFEIPATTGGRVEVQATVDSSNAGSVAETTTLTVRTKGSIVQNARAELERLRERIAGTIDKKGLRRSLTSKLDAAIGSLERARSEINVGRRKQADNALTTATNQLGALLNRLHDIGAASEKESKGRSSGGTNGHSGFSETFERAIANRTEVAIDQLDDARNTPLARD